MMVSPCSPAARSRTTQKPSYRARVVRHHRRRRVHHGRDGHGREQWQHHERRSAPRHSIIRGRQYQQRRRRGDFGRRRGGVRQRGRRNHHKFRRKSSQPAPPGRPGVRRQHQQCVGRHRSAAIFGVFTGSSGSVRHRHDRAVVVHGGVGPRQRRQRHEQVPQDVTGRLGQVSISPQAAPERSPIPA